MPGSVLSSIMALSLWPRALQVGSGLTAVGRWRGGYRHCAALGGSEADGTVESGLCVSLAPAWVVWCGVCPPARTLMTRRWQLPWIYLGLDITAGSDLPGLENPIAETETLSRGGSCQDAQDRPPGIPPFSVLPGPRSWELGARGKHGRQRVGENFVQYVVATP